MSGPRTLQEYLCTFSAAVTVVDDSTKGRKVVAATAFVAGAEIYVEYPQLLVPNSVVENSKYGGISEASGVPNNAIAIAHLWGSLPKSKRPRATLELCKDIHDADAGRGRDDRVPRNYADAAKAIARTLLPQVAGAESASAPEDRETENSLCTELASLMSSCVCNVYSAASCEASGIYLLTSMCNHDCCSNANFSSDESGNLHIIAMRPIAQGEEVCLRYVPYSVLNRKARRDILYKNYGFWCQCESCAGPDTQRILHCPCCIDGVIVPQEDKLCVLEKDEKKQVPDKVTWVCLSATCTMSAASLAASASLASSANLVSSASSASSSVSLSSTSSGMFDVDVNKDFSKTKRFFFADESYRTCTSFTECVDRMETTLQKTLDRGMFEEILKLSTQKYSVGDDMSAGVVAADTDGHVKSVYSLLHPHHFFPFLSRYHMSMQHVQNDNYEQAVVNAREVITIAKAMFPNDLINLSMMTYHSELVMFLLLGKSAKESISMAEFKNEEVLQASAEALRIGQLCLNEGELDLVYVTLVNTESPTCYEDLKKLDKLIDKRREAATAKLVQSIQKVLKTRGADKSANLCNASNCFSIGTLTCPCKVAKYCSKSCQKVHWPEHKRLFHT